MEGRFRPHLVASLDLLGTSALFKNGEEDEMEEFIDTMEGFYNAISENMGAYKAKTFSDNVLLSTDDLSEPNIISFLSSVATLQFNTVCDMHVLIRGGMAMDQLYINDPDDGNDFVIGRALVNAYELESRTAIYPRVIVDEGLVLQFENNGWDDSMLMRRPHSDHSFIDYLQTTMSEGFPDRRKLRLHGSALVDHVKRDRDIHGSDGLLKGKLWDAIRSKDVWALAYHNDFCSRVDADDCRVDFTERYRDGRVVIEFEDAGEGSRMDESTLLDMDFQDLSDSDLAVMFTIGDRPVLKTRLQKITLLFEEIYGVHEPEMGHSAYFFGGYSDEIDESATTLTSAGIIDETGHGYVLTDYGRKLKGYAEKCIENDGDETGMTIIRGIRNIVRSLNRIPDRNVVGLTYHYYQDTAVRSTIKESVDLLNKTAVYNGKGLSDMPRSEFEDILRRGEELHMG